MSTHEICSTLSSFPCLLPCQKHILVCRKEIKSIGNRQVRHSSTAMIPNCQKIQEHISDDSLDTLSKEAISYVNHYEKPHLNGQFGPPVKIRIIKAHVPDDMMEKQQKRKISILKTGVQLAA